MDLDIVRVSRPGCDYDLDVMVGGEWVASAKNFHSADDTATETWYRAVLDQPVVCAEPDNLCDVHNPCLVHADAAARYLAEHTAGDDVPTDNPDIDNEPGDLGPSPLRQPRAATLTSIAIESTLQRNRICANCQGAHITWRCPEIARRLFAPALERAAA